MIGLSRGRRTALIAGLGLAALVVVAVVEWPVLRLRYHALRLDHARTRAEAEPWLAALTGDARYPRAARTLVGLLGPERQWATYWFFAGLLWGQPEDGELIPKRFDDYVPFVEPLQARIEHEEAFLRLWVDYNRFQGSEYGLNVVREFLSDPGDGIIDATLARNLSFDLDDVFKQLAEARPAGMEGRLRLAFLNAFATCWFVSMPPPDRPKAFRIPEVLKELKELNEHFTKRLAAWVKEHRSSMRFDEAFGRFLVDPAAPPGQAGAVFPPKPEKPFFSWQGPLPELPPGRSR